MFIKPATIALAIAFLAMGVTASLDDRLENVLDEVTELKARGKAYLKYCKKCTDVDKPQMIKKAAACADGKKDAYAKGCDIARTSKCGCKVPKCRKGCRQSFKTDEEAATTCAQACKDFVKVKVPKTDATDDADDEVVDGGDDAADDEEDAADDADDAADDATADPVCKVGATGNVPSCNQCAYKPVSASDTCFTIAYISLGCEKNGIDGTCVRFVDGVQETCFIEGHEGQAAARVAAAARGCTDFNSYKWTHD